MTDQGLGQVLTQLYIQDYLIARLNWAEAAFRIIRHSAFISILTVRLSGDANWRVGRITIRGGLDHAASAPLTLSLD